MVASPKQKQKTMTRGYTGRGRGERGGQQAQGADTRTRRVREGKWRAAGGLRKNASNNPVRLGNHSPWKGEPWTNHGEPSYGKSEKYPEHQDGHEESAGVRVDPKAPGSMA